MNVQVVYADGSEYVYNDVSSIAWPNDSDPGQKVTLAFQGDSYVVLNWAYVSEIHVGDN